MQNAICNSLDSSFYLSRSLSLLVPCRCHVEKANMTSEDIRSLRWRERDRQMDRLRDNWARHIQRIQRKRNRGGDRGWGLGFFIFASPPTVAWHFCWKSESTSLWQIALLGRLYSTLHSIMKKRKKILKTARKWKKAGRGSGEWLSMLPKQDGRLKNNTINLIVLLCIDASAHSLWVRQLLNK